MQIASSPKRLLPPKAIDPVGSMPVALDATRLRWCDCDPSRHLQESPGGPTSQQSLKSRLFGGLQKTSLNGGASKERRRRRAEKRLSKRVCLESPFLLCPLKVCSSGEMITKIIR